MFSATANDAAVQPKQPYHVYRVWYSVPPIWTIHRVPFITTTSTTTTSPKPPVITKTTPEEGSDGKADLTPEQEDMLTDFILTKPYSSAEVTVSPKFDDGVENFYPIRSPTYHG